MSVLPSQVSFVIPALNEEAAVAGVVTSLRTRYPESEIIVINDGSKDATAQRAAEAGARVISHDFQRGYGASLRTGTEAAQGPYVLYCDGDGQHSVENVAVLIEACNGHDMVVGARTALSHAPLTRRPGKWVLRRFANYLAGRKIPDLNSGLRIVKKETIMRYIHLMPTGFSFSTTSTFAMIKTNRRLKYVPITTAKRIGTSSVSQFRHGPQTMMLMLRLTVLFEPLKVFLTVSGILALLTVVSFTVNLLFGKKGIAEGTVMLAVSSVIIFMCGLLCDQVSALRREKHE